MNWLLLANVLGLIIMFCSTKIIHDMNLSPGTILMLHIRLLCEFFSFLFFYQCELKLAAIVAIEASGILKN